MRRVSLQKEASIKLGVLITHDMGYVGNHLKKVTPEVNQAIETVETSFRRSPLDYTIETAITTDLLEYLRADVGEQIPARAGYLPGPPANYKHPYLDTFSEYQSIRNVQPEVNIGLSSYFDEYVSNSEPVITDIDANNARVDIGILTPTSHPFFAETKHLPTKNRDAPQDVLEVCIAKGSKYYPPAAVTHAIEVKYIKDKTSPGPGLENDPPTWEKLDGDIRKLEFLVREGANGAGAECHLVLVSNMNLFQVGLDENHPDYRPQFRRRLLNLVQYCEDQKNGNPIHVWDIHPRRA